MALSTGFVNNILSQFEDGQQDLLQELVGNRVQAQPNHPDAMPVSHGFINNIVNQFSDSDSILALLEETSVPKESSLEESEEESEETSEPEESILEEAGCAIEEPEETAAAIYASYTSHLAQLDGNNDGGDEYLEADEVSADEPRPLLQAPCTTSSTTHRTTTSTTLSTTPRTPPGTTPSITPSTTPCTVAIT